jgi:hypothetical protein
LCHQIASSIVGFWDALINQTWQFGGISDEVYMAFVEANWKTSSGQQMLTTKTKGGKAMYLKLNRENRGKDWIHN